MREDLSYGELIDRQNLAVGDFAENPDGERHVIVSILPSEGDDAENPDADRVSLSNGVEYFRDELLACEIPADSV